jgi:hypothetical protein
MMKEFRYHRTDQGSKNKRRASIPDGPPGRNQSLLRAQLDWRFADQEGAMTQEEPPDFQVSGQDCASERFIRAALQRPAGVHGGAQPTTLWGKTATPINLPEEPTCTGFRPRPYESTLFTSTKIRVEHQSNCIPRDLNSDYVKDLRLVTVGPPHCIFDFAPPYFRQTNPIAI